MKVQRTKVQQDEGTMGRRDDGRSDPMFKGVNKLRQKQMYKPTKDILLLEMTCRSHDV